MSQIRIQEIVDQISWLESEYELKGDYSILNQMMNLASMIKSFAK